MNAYPVAKVTPVMDLDVPVAGAFLNNTLVITMMTVEMGQMSLLLHVEVVSLNVRTISLSVKQTNTALIRINSVMRMIRQIIDSIVSMDQTKVSKFVLILNVQIQTVLTNAKE